MNFRKNKCYKNFNVIIDYFLCFNDLYLRDLSKVNIDY